MCKYISAMTLELVCCIHIRVFKFVCFRKYLDFYLYMVIFTLIVRSCKYIIVCLVWFGYALIVMLGRESAIAIDLVLLGEQKEPYSGSLMPPDTTGHDRYHFKALYLYFMNRPVVEILIGAIDMDFTCKQTYPFFDKSVNKFG
jgi:hypothetical protein